MNCAFCQLPQIKERTILKNSLAFAFLTNIPIVEGHLLISPVRCVASFQDLFKEEKLAIFDLVEQLKPVMKELFQAQGFNFAWNENKVAGQSVAHFHLHVIPRRENDSGVDPRAYLYRPGNREVKGEKDLQKIAQTIKEKLK